MRALNVLSEIATRLAEQGTLPDALIRAGIRHQLRARLASLPGRDCEQRAAETRDFLNRMRLAPVALVPEKANAQHYELPPGFFAATLGRHRKYSCAHWGDAPADLAPGAPTGGASTTGAVTLDQAEAEALRITCERAGIRDGMRILELGCGWGSLSLWMARHYPNARIVAVSNAHAQGVDIRARAAAEGLTNLDVITADMNGFDPKLALIERARESRVHAQMIYEGFDRVVSVEMFEHMRNWPELFARVHNWLRPGGRFFMHVFCHRDSPYDFAPGSGRHWMEQHFFSGGLMPSDDLAGRCQRDLHLRQQWRWDGRHYARTANAWLANMDARRGDLMPIFETTYGDDARLWWQRWRIFFMACAELFAFDRGQQWWVSHYLFERPVNALTECVTGLAPRDRATPDPAIAGTPADDDISPRRQAQRDAA